MSVVKVVFCEVVVSATGRAIVQRSLTECGASECCREALAHLRLLHHGIKSSRSVLSCTRFETWRCYRLPSPTVCGFLRPVSENIIIQFPCRPRPNPSNCYLSPICLIRQCCLLHLNERHEIVTIHNHPFTLTAVVVLIPVSVDEIVFFTSSILNAI
jgi:hypothetical protein